MYGKSLPHCSQVRSMLDRGWGGLGDGGEALEGHSFMMINESESNGNVGVGLENLIYF